MVDFLTNKLPEDTRVSIDDGYLKLYPSSDGLMHDECVVGIGTTAHWYLGDGDVPPEAQLHHTVIEHLKIGSCSKLQQLRAIQGGATSKS